MRLSNKKELRQTLLKELDKLDNLDSNLYKNRQRILEREVAFNRIEIMKGATEIMKRVTDIMKETTSSQ